MRRKRKKSHDAKISPGGTDASEGMAITRPTYRIRAHHRERLMIDSHDTQRWLHDCEPQRCGLYTLQPDNEN